MLLFLESISFYFKAPASTYLIFFGFKNLVNIIYLRFKCWESFNIW